MPNKPIESDRQTSYRSFGDPLIDAVRQQQ